jgi:hypothetical protein
MENVVQEVALEAFDEEGYRKFQELIMEQRYNIELMLQAHTGSAVRFQIADAWKTAFPRNLYHNLASIQIIKPFRGRLDIDLPRASSINDAYEGAGPFVTQINVIRQEEFDFYVTNQ